MDESKVGTYVKSVYVRERDRAIEAENTPAERLQLSGLLVSGQRLAQESRLQERREAGPSLRDKQKTLPTQGPTPAEPYPEGAHARTLE